MTDSKSPTIKFRKKGDTKPVVTEKQIELSILDYLATIPNCKAWKNQTTGIFDVTTKRFRTLSGKYSGKGSADILACLNGHFVAIEVKKPVGSQIRPDQLKFLDDIVRSGGVGFIATSIADAEEGLRAAGLIS